MTNSLSKTDYLVVGDNPGSKFDRAESYGINIIREKDLLAMLN